AEDHPCATLERGSGLRSGHRAHRVAELARLPGPQQADSRCFDEKSGISVDRAEDPRGDAGHDIYAARHLEHVTAFVAQVVLRAVGGAALGYAEVQVAETYRPELERARVEIGIQFLDNAKLADWRTVRRVGEAYLVGQARAAARNKVEHLVEASRSAEGDARRRARRAVQQVAQGRIQCRCTTLVANIIRQQEEEVGRDLHADAERLEVCLVRQAKV